MSVAVEKKPWVMTPARRASIDRAREVRAEKTRLRRETEERAAGTCTVLLAGVDTLNLSSRAELREGLVAELTELKAEAVKAGREGLSAPRWRSTALGIDLEVQPYGTRKGSLVLTSDALVLVLNPTGPKNLPRAYVELKAPFLWSGWENASDKACAVLAEVAVDDARADVQVSRLDLAVDFMGWQPTPAMLEHVIGKVVRRNQNHEVAPRGKKPANADRNWFQLHDTGRTFTGFTFGGGDLLCRLYDKTVEIQRSGKQWFIPKWAAAGYVDEDTSGHVWRLEFQIRREPLREAELVTHDKESVEVKGWRELRGGLNELWRYLTKKWLTYRLPRTGRERVRLHPRWRALMAASFVDQPDGELFRHRQALAFDKCTGALSGYLKREVALFLGEQGQLPGEARFPEDVERIIRFAIDHYEKKHGETLYDAMAHKWRQQRAFEAMFKGVPQRTHVRA